MLKCLIINKNLVNGVEQEFNVSEGAVFTENYNETLDSGTIVIPHLTNKIEIEPYDIVKINSSLDSKVRIETRYMCVDTYVCTQTSLDPAIYEYNITLFSLTKLLEGILLPSLSITRLKTGTPRKVWYYLQQFLDEYGTKLSANATDGYTNPLFIYGWNIVNIATASSFFNDTECPEFQWNEPTLREVITDLMMVKDCIPVVTYDIIGKLRIDYMNVSQTRGDITSAQRSGINYIRESQSSADYVSELKTKLVNSIGEGEITKICEDITFRNYSTYLLTTENVMVETSLPIWKLKSIKVVHNLKGSVPIAHRDHPNVTVFSVNIDTWVEKDLKDFTLEQKDWQTKDIFYEPFTSVNDKDLDANYQNTCLYYTIGAKGIHNFDAKQETKMLWIKSQVSVLQLILGTISEDPSGEMSTANVVAMETAVGENWPSGQDPTQYLINWDGISLKQSSFDSGSANLYIDWQSCMFRVEYEALGEHVFLASKSPFQAHKRQVIDNQSQSYVNIKNQGMLEYLKANRLGNQVKLINARYKLNESATPKLANTIDDSIIFQKQISVYDNFIKANYQATKNYVLRDYFTGIKSKLRSWLIVSGKEAFTRADVCKFYVNKNLASVKSNYVIPVYLSEEYDSSKGYNVGDFCIYSGTRYVCNAPTGYGSFRAIDWTSTGLTGLTETMQDYIDKFKYCTIKFTTKNGNKPGAGDFIWYSGGVAYNYAISAFMVEFQKAKCGNSVIFTIKCYDNTLAGKYVASEDYSISSSVSGMTQKNASYTDSDGEITGGEICFYDKFDENLPYTNGNKLPLSHLLPGVAFSQFPNDGVSKSIPLCKIPFTIHKDNKEILQITIQFEENNEADDIFLGKTL